MEIFNLYSGSWRSNCYLLCDPDEGVGAVIDPSEDAHRIAGIAAGRGVKIERILLTHAHFDHILALDDLRSLTGAPLAMHEDDVENLFDPHKSAYDLVGGESFFRAPERKLKDGDVIALGSHKIKVFHTPGHTKGSCCFAADGCIFTGDTLFSDGYGRCDLYGGSYSQMLRSLERLGTLDPDLIIYPGHGGACRLGEALKRI